MAGKPDRIWKRTAARPHHQPLRWDAGFYHRIQCFYALFNGNGIRFPCGAKQRNTVATTIQQPLDVRNQVFMVYPLEMSKPSYFHLSENGFQR